MNYEECFLWDEIFEYRSHCGKSESPKDLAVAITEKLRLLVPYDQARIYCINTDGQVSDEILYGVDARWPNAYYEHYSKILGGRYSIFGRTTKNGYRFIPKVEDCFYDWTNAEKDEFVAGYIRPQRIRYSFGFGLHDNHNICRKVCMFDRIYGKSFTEPEKKIFSLIVPHLENLHKNFYIEPQGGEDCSIGKNVKGGVLTEREMEITDLIRKGLSPQSIAQILFVSHATVYKHITHIHTKMGVSNRQELTIKLIESQINLEKYGGGG
jgi:DNA-binding CsgD family transcriptional regulator